MGTTSVICGVCNYPIMEGKHGPDWARHATMHHPAQGYFRKFNYDGLLTFEGRDYYWEVAHLNADRMPEDTLVPNAWARNYEYLPGLVLPRITHVQCERPYEKTPPHRHDPNQGTVWAEKLPRTRYVVTGMYPEGREVFLYRLGEATPGFTVSESVAIDIAKENRGRFCNVRICEMTV